MQPPQRVPQGEPLGRPPLGRLFLRAWGRRCPRCGVGTLFLTRFRLRRSCSICALIYRREPGAMTGQMYLSAAVTQLFAALCITLIWLGTDWGPGLSIAVSVPVVVAFCYWFLPRSMALWVAIEFLTDVANGDVPGRVGPS